MSSNINDKGNFSTLLSLQLKYPTGKAWWYATVWDIVYLWDIVERKWDSRATDANTLNWQPWSYYLNELNHTRNFNTVSASWILDTTFRITKVDCTTWNITITLPTAVWFTWILDIIKIDLSTNSVIINTTGWQTISWESSQDILWQYDTITLISDNSNWLIN